MANENKSPVNDSMSDQSIEGDSYENFRNEISTFAKVACPPEIKSVVASGNKITKREYLAWQQILCERGWGAPNWPKEYGGTGWNIKQRMIFEEVMAEEDCPALYHHGLVHIGSVILQFGTPEQKAFYLPRILDGTDWWCQGYSEPGSGSDLASLSTKAERQGDHYCVNGQKIWTSHAHEANMIYMLVRTSKEERKQNGISMLLVPLDTPGITIRPIKTIDGWKHLNEVFFDNVLVPTTNLLGSEGQGWACAKYLLERERLPPATIARLIRMRQHVSRLVEGAISTSGSQRDLSSLPQRLILAEADLLAAKEILSNATDSMLQQKALGATPSVLKLYASNIAQRLVSIALDAIGPAAVNRYLPIDGVTDSAAIWVQNYMYFRARTIAGGTTEVQRNVVARTLFDD